MESPVPFLPLSTPDVETEKLIKMKDEEVSRPSHHIITLFLFFCLHKPFDKVENDFHDTLTFIGSEILTIIDVKFTVAENARDASENAAADA